MKINEETSMVKIRLILVTIMGIFVSICFAQPVAPQVSIEIMIIEGVDHVKLSWEAVEGAELYNIYVSAEAYPEDWGYPLTTVGGEVTEYIFDSVEDLGRVHYFYVTSYAEPGFPDWLILVDGDRFNGNVQIDPFYISKYEVKQSDFADVMGEWNFNFGGNPTNPAEMVTWFDAIEYCNRLSISEGLIPVYSYGTEEVDPSTNPDDWYGRCPGWNETHTNHINVSCDWEADGYRLPTEAEWHHAANGAVHNPESGWPLGNPYQFAGSDNVFEVAWFSDNADRTTHPVGEKLPNGLGIYDMSGNVFEWCWDIYGTTFPSGGDNPRGADGVSNRVYRGGCWLLPTADSRVSSRSAGSATFRYIFLGFRIGRIIS